MKRLSKKVRTVGIRAAFKIGEGVQKFAKDKKASPGVEEAALLLFVGLVVANSADTLGTTIQSVYTNVNTALRTAIGI